MDRKNSEALWLTLLIVYVIAICYTFFTPQLPIHNMPVGFDKLAHFGEFFVLSLILLKNAELFVPKDMTLAFLLLYALAIVTEVIQLNIPSRSFSWYDFLADAFGITLGMLGFMVLKWIQDRL